MAHPIQPAPVLTRRAPAAATMVRYGAIPMEIIKRHKPGGLFVSRQAGEGS